MTLLTALLRSAYLAFLVGYTLAVSPLGLLWGGTAEGPPHPVPVAVVQRLFVAAWLAIGWIALEAAVAWLRVWLEARDRRRSVPVPPPPAT